MRKGIGYEIYIFVGMLSEVFKTPDLFLALLLRHYVRQLNLVDGLTVLAHPHAAVLGASYCIYQTVCNSLNSENCYFLI